MVTFCLMVSQPGRQNHLIQSLSLLLIRRHASRRCQSHGRYSREMRRGPWRSRISPRSGSESRKTQHRRGKSSELSTALTRRWSWRQVSTKCPDDEAFRKSTEPMEFSLAAFWSEKRIEETKRKEGGPRGGKKGGTEGQIWVPIPVGIEGMGKYH